jgi:HEPN domain-containing protein
MLAPDPEVIEVLRKWVEKAEADLFTAAHMLKLGPAAPADTIGFYAQQCVEKYIKALLVWHALDFPKTHNLTLLFERLPERFRPECSADERLQLTAYATVTRYLGDHEPVTLTVARRAVTLARRVRRQVWRWLPKQAL